MKPFVEQPKLKTMTAEWVSSAGNWAVDVKTVYNERRTTYQRHWVHNMSDASAEQVIEWFRAYLVGIELRESTCPR